MEPIKTYQWLLGAVATAILTVLLAYFGLRATPENPLPAPTASPSALPSPIVSATPTIAPSATPTPKSTALPTPTPSPVVTISPQPTPTPSSIPTPTPTASALSMKASDWFLQYGASLKFDSTGMVFSSPKVASTSAAMVPYVPSDSKKGGLPVGNFIVEMDVTTTKQLRDVAPANHECFWFVWGYIYNADNTKVMNSLVIKPNGIQVSIASDKIQETFLYTGLPATFIGQERHVKVQFQNPNLKVWLDNALVLDKSFTGGDCNAVENDGVTATKRPCVFYSQPGALAAYVEDSEARVNNFKLTRL